MAVVIGIVGALTALIWAFIRFSNAAREGQSAVKDISDLVRSNRHSRKIDKRLIENLSDPRESAAILLLQTATYKGILGAEAQNQIIGLMRESFESDEDTAIELFAFAKVALNEINDTSNSLRKILRPVRDVCSLPEKENLVEMMQAVSTFEGVANDQQELIVSETRRYLLPK